MSPREFMAISVYLKADGYYIVRSDGETFRITRGTNRRYWVNGLPQDRPFRVLKLDIRLGNPPFLRLSPRGV